MTEVTEDVEAVVEDTQLPRRLKDEIYETIADRDEEVTPEHADEIARAVEHRYIETRVDPLDPVGTVSAQSIGEPGTQMSVPHDERVVVRRRGDTTVTEIGPLVDELLEAGEPRTFDDHEVARAPGSLEVLSLRSDERVEWKPVEEVSRHGSPDELLRFELESGRTIRATKAHSFVTRRENDVVPVEGADLEEGDWIPVVNSFESDGVAEVDLREHLPPEEYRYTSTLTDGGAASLPGGEDQVRNERRELKAGSPDEHAVYPRQGTVSLPERFPLDEETGFFIGAFLAEGNVTDHYVSVPNVDEAFQNRVRSFADRFDLSTSEYENESGVATGYDVRVDGTVLADFLRAACYEDGQKVVPDFAFGATDEFVAGLLAGYFSGDGNVGKPSIRSSSTSERLTEEVALLLARVGVYATRGQQDDSSTLRIPSKHVVRFDEEVGMVGTRGEQLSALAEEIDPDGPDATDQIPNFGDTLKRAATEAGIPSRQVHSAHERQRIGRNRLARLVDEIRERTDEAPESLDVLERAVGSEVVWNRIESIETVSTDHEYVYDFSVAGLDTFTTAQGVVTHNTMNTFHYAGVAEIDVTQGLPRLIELVDARKEPDTPMMTVHLDGEYATERERAHEVVWKIEATEILALGDISTNVADMRVQIDLNEETLRERWPKTRIAEVPAKDLPMMVFESGGPDELSWVQSDGFELTTREETDEEQIARAIGGPAAVESEAEAYHRVIDDPESRVHAVEDAEGPMGVVIVDEAENVWGISVESRLRDLKRHIKDDFQGDRRDVDDLLDDETYEAMAEAIADGRLDRVVVPDAGIHDQRGIRTTIEDTFGDEISDVQQQGTVIAFGPAEPSYRDLLQLVERLRDVVFKGIEDVSRVVIRKEEAPPGSDHDEEFVLYTEGSALTDVLDIWGVDASRTKSNNIHEIRENLGIEAARNAIIDETMDTLEEQGLDDVNIRHLMLVADIMTNRGSIESIGRHGISGSKESVLARAAFEVTVNHLLDAAVHGEVDDLNGVTENVIVGKPIKLGTGDVDLRMGSFSKGTAGDAD